MFCILGHIHETQVYIYEEEDEEPEEDTGLGEQQADKSGTLVHKSQIVFIKNVYKVLEGIPLNPRAYIKYTIQLYRECLQICISSGQYKTTAHMTT